LITQSHTSKVLSRGKTNWLYRKVFGDNSRNNKLKIIDLDSEQSLKNAEMVFENVRKVVIKKIDRNEYLANLSILKRDFSKKKRKEDIGR